MLDAMQYACWITDVLITASLLQQAIGRLPDEGLSPAEFFRAVMFLVSTFTTGTASMRTAIVKVLESNGGVTYENLRELVDPPAGAGTGPSTAASASRATRTSSAPSRGASRRGRTGRGPRWC